MFWHSAHNTAFTSTRNLSRIPRKGLPPTFFMGEERLLPSEKHFILPAWGSRETRSLKHNGVTFKSTRNSNDGFIGAMMSDEVGALPEPCELVGLSVQTLATKSFALLGNMEDWSISFYADVTDWLLNNPLWTFDNPDRNSEGKWDFEQEVKFKVVSLTIRSLNVSNRMPRVSLARPASFYQMTSDELLDFRYDQEIKGEGFASGLALKSCDFSFIDLKGTFDRYNPKSPFCEMDLRNFEITSRIDYYKNGYFTDLVASYELGVFYGDAIESSGTEKTSKMKGSTRLWQLKDMKTKRHYYIKSNLGQVLRDLFMDLGAVVCVDASLDQEIILYQFLGGEVLEATLKVLCEKYRLIVSQSVRSEILIRRIESSSIKTPSAFFHLSNEFKYTAAQRDKVVNKLTVKQSDNTLSDEGLDRYWLASLLPLFREEGAMCVKTVAIEKDGTTEEIDVLENAQSLLELPKLLLWDSTKRRVYNARNPNVPKGIPTLDLKETFEATRETYINDILLSKDNNSESQPSYLEFEWFSQDCFYQSIPSSLITIKIWAYAEACHQFVEYKRTYGDNLEYDEDGYAILEKAEPYRGGEEGQSLFYAEAQITPPLENRGKLLRTEQISLKPARGRIKEITQETREKADIVEFEASAGQVWDKIESDLVLPEGCEGWLWVEETFSEDKVKVRYLNLSSSSKSYDIRVYGREFVKVERSSGVYENLESQAIYGTREGEVENLNLDQIEAYLKLHAKPWDTVALEVQGNPVICVGDVLQYMSEYQGASDQEYV